MLSIAILVCLSIAVIYLIISVKKLAKDERLVFFKKGKPDRLVGPGLIFAMPGLQRTARLNLRPSVTHLPDIHWNADGGPLLVRGRYTSKITDPTKACLHKHLSKAVLDVVTETLRELLLNATFADCLVDKLILTKLAEDLANEKTGKLGVKILKLECSSFPAHRLIAAQIAYLSTILIDELGFLADKVG